MGLVGVDMMTSVVHRPRQVEVDTLGTTLAAPADPEDLLGRVLDNETVTALAEQARGRGWRCWVRAGCCSS